LRDFLTLSEASQERDDGDGTRVRFGDACQGASDGASGPLPEYGSGHGAWASEYPDSVFWRDVTASYLEGSDATSRHEGYNLRVGVAGVVFAQEFTCDSH
jgi:hypothetical protein